MWVPKLGGAEKNVAEATQAFTDPRGRHFWDEGGRLMARYAKRLGISRDAWDVFFLYGPAARWEGSEPPAPDFWMHQLASVDAAPRLDGKKFAAEALGRLRTAGVR